MNGRNYPEGFFQKFSDRFRWGTAAYWGSKVPLSPSRVLFSTLRLIGPTIPPGGIRDANGELIQSSRPNPLAEWDEKTREFIVPKKDATALFPYTYNFGILGDQHFLVNLVNLDEPAELLHEALRYYRGGKEPTPEFIQLSQQNYSPAEKADYGNGARVVEHCD